MRAAEIVSLVMAAAALGVVISDVLKRRKARREPPPPFSTDSRGDDTSDTEPDVYIDVRLPYVLDPVERGDRFEDPLDALLRAAGAGQASGGGTELFEGGVSTIDVDIYDLASGLPILRESLIQLGAPEQTAIEYSMGDQRVRETLSEGTWRAASKPS